MQFKDETVTTLITDMKRLIVDMAALSREVMTLKKQAIINQRIQDKNTVNVNKIKKHNITLQQQLRTLESSIRIKR